MTVSAPLTTLHFYQSHLKFLSFLFFCYLLFVILFLHYYIQCEYSTIIPRAQMGSESIAHVAEGRMGY